MSDSPISLFGARGCQSRDPTRVATGTTTRIRMTPNAGLLHAGPVGDGKRFTRQDGVEQCWRVMQPLLDEPSTMHEHAMRSWAPVVGRQLVAGRGRPHEPLVDVMLQRPPSRGRRISRRMFRPCPCCVGR
jgi:hypothetical protein